MILSGSPTQQGGGAGDSQLKKVSLVKANKILGAHTFVSEAPPFLDPAHSVQILQDRTKRGFLVSSKLEEFILCILNMKHVQSAQSATQSVPENSITIKTIRWLLCARTAASQQPPWAVRCLMNSKEYCVLSEHQIPPGPTVHLLLFYQRRTSTKASTQGEERSNDNGTKLPEKSTDNGPRLRTDVVLHRWGHCSSRGAAPGFRSRGARSPPRQGCRLQLRKICHGHNKFSLHLKTQWRCVPSGLQGGSPRASSDPPSVNNPCGAR